MENIELLKVIKEMYPHHKRTLAVQLKMITRQEQMMVNMDTYQAKMDAAHKMMMAKERMEANMNACPRSEESQGFGGKSRGNKESEAEHEKVPKEHATVDLAKKCHGQPEESNEGNCVSQKKLVTGMNMTHRVNMSQRKGQGKDNVVQGTLKRQTFGRWH